MSIEHAPLTSAWIIHFDGWTDPNTGQHFPAKPLNPPRLFRTREEAEQHHSTMASHPPREHYSVREVFVYLKPFPVPDCLSSFDKAVADVLPRVSHVEYDSHEICEHFAGKVRERIAMLAAGKVGGS